jgi:beta-N-acetylhexosaminidase
VVGVDPEGPGEATTLVEDHHVGGLFIGGTATGLLTSGALQQLRAASPTGLVVAVDEEGGRVQRIDALDGDVPSARQLAATRTPAQVQDLATERGRRMAALGITVDFAPVVDVSDQPARSVIGDRSFSTDPDVVVRYAGAYAQGLVAAGITPVLKHFPGHGSASGDTHEGAAATPALGALRARDLVPYAALLPTLGDRGAVMLGHLTVPGLTEEGLPASLSPATVRLLRDEYHFGGVVMTDDLATMAAITDRFDPAGAAERALVAGVDVILFAGVDVAGLLDHLERAVAADRLDPAALDASVVRTLRWKGLDPCAIAL